VIRDISRPLANGFPAWPGDPPFAASPAASISRGDPCDVTRLTMSAHAGTHLDAPSHVIPGAPALASIPLDLLVGPALVVHVPGTSILEAGDLRDAIAAAGEGTGEEGPVSRILIRTESAESLPSMPVAFACLSAGAARFLLDRGVRLVGIDTPSVDSPGAASLPVHRLLAAGGAAIVEWLDLRGVRPGSHQLVALPLRIEGIEASPVRAVLLDASGGR
jgi:arylformamidase